MMKLFKYEGDDHKLKEAKSIANFIFDRLISRLRVENAPIMSSKRKRYLKKPNGDLYTSTDLAMHMMRFAPEITMQIKEYTYRNGNVKGYFTASRPNDININRKSLPREVFSLVATFYHEFIHRLDIEVDYDLGHGKGWFRNRYKRWKEECAPFLVDYFAEVEAAIYLGIEDIERTDNTKYVSIPLWKRVLFFWRY